MDTFHLRPKKQKESANEKLAPYFGPIFGNQTWEEYFRHNMLKVKKSFGRQDKMANIICKLNPKHKETFTITQEYW